MSQKLQMGEISKEQSVILPQTWFPKIIREFPEDEKDFGEWCYND